MTPQLHSLDTAPSMISWFQCESIQSNTPQPLKPDDRHDISGIDNLVSLLLQNCSWTIPKPSNHSDKY